MKSLAHNMWILLALLLVACTQNPSQQNAFTIPVDVVPNPPILGESTLLITLTDHDGQAIHEATITVHGFMEHEGMLPVDSQADTSENGEWQIPFTWTMTGVWLLDVRAELANHEDIVQQQFEFTVVSNAAEQNASDNTKELLITIPEGTQALMDTGQEPNVIPNEITLKLSEYNTLVIVNDDVSDHFVGPFFIKAGESVRQVFTRPVVYEGGCTIHKDKIVRIIVEE